MWLHSWMGLGHLTRDIQSTEIWIPGAMKLHCKLGIVIVSLYILVASQPHYLDTYSSFVDTTPSYKRAEP